jgi:hypothetical protein
MGKGLRRRSPALLIACLALFAALGGSVYAATKIDGRSIRVKSMPGNRLAPGSLPGNRLKQGTVPSAALVPGAIAGAQIDTATLGQVPSAAQADRAESARSAETALSALNALDANKVNGHSAGCATGTRFFAGACWQTASGTGALPAAAAAIACADQGGELPEALALAAFSQQPGIELAAGDEWTREIPVISGSDVYGVITVSNSGEISHVASTLTKRYRCVIPLVT